MNILYVSKIDGRPWSGPTYSVPNQVKSQSLFDNVLWYNLVYSPRSEGVDNVNQWRNESFYCDLTNYPSGRVCDLPAPFSKPDLIIVEQGYPFAKEAIRYEILKMGIPYIVVPRGELTASAQNKKKIKKLIGNIVLGYYKFMKNAIAIHFLTKQEQSETSSKWYNNGFVIPNGTNVPKNVERHMHKDGLQCVSIGRLEPYHKGLDLLIGACAGVKKQLIENKVRIDFYGSNVENKLEGIVKLIEEKQLKDIITIHNGVFGKEKERVLQCADVFFMTSRFEGHPTGLLEALAYGLPCLVTTGSNMRHEIEDTNSGWGADNNEESIQEAILRMLADISSFPVKSKNARELALGYDWEHIAQNSHDVYEQLLQH